MHKKIMWVDLGRGRMLGKHKNIHRNRIHALKVITVKNEQCLNLTISVVYSNNRNED